MPDQPQQLELFVPAKVTALPGGAFKVTPGKPEVEYTVMEVSKMLRVSPDTVRRMIREGVLRARRPAKRKLLVDGESVARRREESLVEPDLI